MGATLKDIAEATGLSVSSVSLVLNGRPNRISEENRRRIMETAKKLEYVPNQTAVSLITKKSRTIGLILPDITNMFFAQMAKGAETRSSELGYSLVLCNTNDSPEKDDEYIQVLLSRGVDGILLVSSYRPGREIEDSTAHVKSIEKPLVLIDRGMESFEDAEGLTGVFFDNEQGGYMAAQQLIALGHEKIGCITGPMGSASARNRLLGYARALQEAGIEFDPELVKEGDFKSESGSRLGGELIDKGVTAIFACSDMMAYGVYRAAYERQLKVPEQLSVLGFDDLEFSDIIQPRLSSVGQCAYEMGSCAVEKIVRMINNPEAEEQAVILRPRLISRESTARRRD